jgi:hypothetical protein
MSDDKLIELLQIINLQIQEEERIKARDIYRIKQDEKKEYQKNYYKQKDIRNIERFNSFLKEHKIKKQD